MRVTRGLISAGEVASSNRRPLSPPVASSADLSLLNPLEPAGTEDRHECKSEEGKISQEHARRVRVGSDILFQ